MQWRDCNREVSFTTERYALPVTETDHGPRQCQLGTREPARNSSSRGSIVAETDRTTVVATQGQAMLARYFSNHAFE